MKRKLGALIRIHDDGKVEDHTIRAAISEEMIDT
jgi:hypothetical protein